jgi:protein TonB
MKNISSGIIIGLLVVVLAACAAGQNRPMQLLSGSSPIYPAEAKAGKVEGSVVVRYGVSVDGRVINARVESAEPEGVFEAAALEAVRSWRYNPAVRDGEPVAVSNIVSTVNFQLGETNQYDEY